MILAGLQKHSLIDYPGKISCVVFTTGCNFQCPYCHNPDLAQGRYPVRLSEAHLKAFLTPRRGFLDAVVITGGEPTLHPELASLCTMVGKLGLKVKLDTNGSRPDALYRLIDLDCVDYIAMDLKTSPSAYPTSLCREPLGEKIMQSIQMIMDSAVDYEFRTTCVRPYVDETTLPEMVNAIKGARRYFLQHCNSSTMLEPRYFEGAGTPFTDADLIKFQTIAAPLVDSCSIR
jgi:pyruvate formate lyase activating enzyme